MSKRYSSNLQIAHAFVHDLTEAGHSANTSFANGVFFSYSTPIAVKIGHTILLTTESYSNTTSKHKSNLRSASINVCQIILARYLPTDLRDKKGMAAIHNLNCEFFTNNLEECLKKFIETTRSRIKKAKDLLGAFDELETYCLRFDIQQANLHTLQNQVTLQAIEQARVEIAIHNDKTSIGENLGLRGVALRNTYHELILDSFIKWRSCETDKLPLNKLSSPIALRITKDRIETSRGASMPRREVARIWPNLKSMWQSCNGEPTLNKDVHPTTLLQKIAASNQTMRFGQFTGVIVSKAFIRIGCHDIPWGEIVDVAKQLGLDVTGVDDANTTN